MIEKSIAKSFLDKALNSYDLENINELVIILLKNELIENFFNNYLENNKSIKKYKFIILHKETSGSICTSLMAVSELVGQTVTISALDQLLPYQKINHNQYIENNSNFDIIAPVYSSSDNSLCFTLKDDEGGVIQLFEKKPVSNDAILGVYIIRDFSDFLSHCHELLIRYKGFKNRIFYTSDVINSYIGKDFKCYFPEYNQECFKVRSVQDFEAIK